MQLAADKVFSWSDEKSFPMEAVVNNQNDRFYVTSPGTIPEGVRTHFYWQKPTGNMAWAATASDVSKSSLLFIEEVKVNSRVNQQMLKKDMLPWLSATFRNHYTFLFL